MPSGWYEAGTPLVAVRSMGVGTPVITSDLKNLSAGLLSDGADWAFATGDPSSLSARLLALVAEREAALDNRPLWRELLGVPVLTRGKSHCARKRVRRGAPVR